MNTETVVDSVPVLNEPPTRSRGRGRIANPVHAAAADLAINNPGEWVKVGSFKSSQASQIKNGRHKSYAGPPGTWEATARTSNEDSNLKTLWVRWGKA